MNIRNFTFEKLILLSQTGLIGGGLMGENFFSLRG